MARKRMIDPSIWTDDGMAGLTARQQLLYIGLFSNADDKGRLKGSARAIRLLLPAVYFGVGDPEIAADLDHVLTEMRGLVRYEVEGRAYLAFRNYDRWQRISHPSPSAIPAPPEDTIPAPEPSRNTPEPSHVVEEPSPNGTGGLTEDSPPVKLRELKEITTPSASVFDAALPLPTQERLVPPDRRGEPQPPTPTNAKSKNPLPRHGPAQTCVAIWCELAGVSEPASYKQAVGIGQQIVNAGLSEDDIRHLYGWLATQRWRADGIDLGTMRANIDKWRAAGCPDGTAEMATAEAERKRQFAAQMRRDPKAADLGGRGKAVLY